MNTISHLNELKKKNFPEYYSAASKLVAASKSKDQSMVSGIPKKYIKEADLNLVSDISPPPLTNRGSYPSRGPQIYDISPEVLRKNEMEAEIIRKNKLNILRNSYTNGVVF
jgi:hypothetical protein